MADEQKKEKKKGFWKEFREFIACLLYTSRCV